MGRALGVLAGIVLLVAGGYGLLAFFNARDDAGVTATDPRGPGEQLDELAGLPLAGEHAETLAPADRRTLSRDELLHALELGNVVLAYPTARPPRALVALQRDLAGPYDPEVAAAGQAVLLVRAPGVQGAAALAWRHAEQVADPADARLGAFAEYWLGRGPGSGAGTGSG